MKRNFGFTLTELLITVSLIGVVAAIGGPQLLFMIKDNRRAAEVNRFVTSITLARTEAIKRRTPLSVCKSADGATCTTAGNWNNGYIVFINTDGDDPPAVDAGETILRISEANANNIQITGFGDFADSVTYGYDGYPELAATSTGGRFNFCDDRGASHARAVIVSNTGRARLSTDTDADGIHEDESNNDLTC